MKIPQRTRLIGFGLALVAALAGCRGADTQAAAEAIAGWQVARHAASGARDRL